jgi:hypothetical protein
LEQNYFIWHEKNVKRKTCYGKSEEKGEFGNPWNESLGFKCGTLIMLEPQGQWR